MTALACDLRCSCDVRESFVRASFIQLLPFSGHLHMRPNNQPMQKNRTTEIGGGVLTVIY